MKHLFIGGCADGEQISVRDSGGDVRIPFQLPGGGLASNIYGPRRLVEADGSMLVVYVHAGITNPLSMLISGYKPKDLNDATGTG